MRIENSPNAPDLPFEQQRLLAAAVAEGGNALCIEATRERVAELIADADHVQFRAPAFGVSSRVGLKRADVATVSGPVSGRAYPSQHSGAAGGIGDMHVRSRRPNRTGRPQARRARHPRSWRDTAAVGIPRSVRDGLPPLERFLLTAASEGLTATYLNQPIEGTVRDRARITFVLNATPQLLLRIGRGHHPEHPLHRPLADVFS